MTQLDKYLKSIIELCITYKVKSEVKILLNPD